MTTVEIFKQRLIGKPRDAIVDEFVQSVRRRSYAITDLILEYYPDVILSMLKNAANVYQSKCYHNTRVALYAAMRTSNHNVVKFILDSGVDIDPIIDHQLAMTLCRYVLLNCGSRYITKVFQTEFIVSIIPKYYNNNIKPRKLMVAIGTVAKCLNNSCLEILYTCDFSKPVVECICMIILESDIENEDDAYNFMNEISVYAEGNNLNDLIYKAIMRVSDSFPHVVYQRLSAFSDYYDTDQMYIFTFKYAVARCDIQMLHDYTPNFIIIFEKYLILMNAGFNPQYMSKRIIFTLNQLRCYRNDVLSILAHHNARGYTVFDSLEYSPGNIDFALKLYNNDESAKRYYERMHVSNI